MRTVETKVYNFDELSDDAKDRARQWWRETTAQYQDHIWAEFTIEDAVKIAAILGIEISTRTVKLMNESTKQEPVIWWDLDPYSRGVCFSGTYSHNKGMRAKLHAYCQDKALDAICGELLAAQKACGYRAVVDIKADDRTIRMEYTDVSNFGNPESPKDAPVAVIERIESALRNFAGWICDRLEAEYDYQNADAQVDEAIRSNEYEFTEEGDRAS